MNDEQMDLNHNVKIEKNEEDVNKVATLEENRNSQMSQESIKSSLYKSNNKSAKNNFNSFIKAENSKLKDNFNM